MSKQSLKTRSIKARSWVGLAARTGTPEQAQDARRDYAAIRLEELITEKLDSVPPLTLEQFERLHAVLRSYEGGAK